MSSNWIITPEVSDEEPASPTSLSDEEVTLPKFPKLHMTPEEPDTPKPPETP